MTMRVAVTVNGTEYARDVEPRLLLQCGFCTPGMMMTARWLLDHHPDPDEAQIREVISGQICRCTGYENIVRSIRWAAKHSRDTP